MNLFKKKECYGVQYNDHLLEQWKTCVEMANSNSERRISSNNVYITINAAIFAFISSTSDFKNIILSIVGVFVCIIWIFSINSYKKLNNIKFKVINEIEKELPAEPFTYEWKLIQDSQKYKRFTKIEKLLPWIFIGVYTTLTFGLT